MSTRTPTRPPTAGPTTADLGPLFRPVPRRRGRPERKPIGVCFAEFHAANPWVYERLARMARSLIARGHRRFSIDLLFNVLRYRAMRRAIDPNSDFALNNNYRALYARLLMQQEPDLADVFETRKQTAR